MHVPRNNLESRIEALVPDKTREIVVYCASGPAPRSRRSRSTSSATRTSSTSPAASPTGSGTATSSRPRRAHPRAAHALRAPPPDPRGRRGGPAEAARRARAPDRRRRARLAGVALPRRRGRRARSASSTPTSSTTRTCSARSSTRPNGSASRRCVREAHDRGAQPRRQRRPVPGAARRPRTSSGSSPHGWDVIVDGADNFPTRYLVNDASVWHGIPVVHGSIYRFEGQVTVFHPGRRPVLPLPLPRPAAARARAELRGGRRARRAAGHRRLAAGERGAEARARRRRDAHRPAAPVRRAAHDVRRGRDPPQPECPVCGENPTITEYIDYVEFCTGGPGVHA